MNKQVIVALCGFSMLTAGCALEVTDSVESEVEEAVEERTAEAAQAAFSVAKKDVTKLCVSASDHSGAGTTDDIRLRFYTTSDRRWECTITETIPSGTTKCCVPTEGDTEYGRADYDQLKVSYSGSNDDGLRIGKISYTLSSGNSQTWNRFGNDGGLDCMSYDLWSDTYASCWLDGDDHNNCSQMDIDLMTNVYAEARCH